VRVTDRVVAGSDSELVLHPPVLALGVGCERGAAAADLIALADNTLRQHGLAPAAVACVASIDVKADEAAVHAVAEQLGVPARFFTAAELEAQTPRLLNPSDTVFRAVGCHGVAEGAALAAAGSGSSLIVEKTRGTRATCAIARAALAIAPHSVGRARGRLTVVGIGPGDAAWRSPAASHALAAATDVVGYGLYLDLIAETLTGKRRHASSLTEEEARVRLALDLAAEGRSVALVSSGDAGVYGLATLVFELLDREDRPDWNRLAITVVPGISALQAAAARIGAPIGHDFCAVSLSDLLTPWPEIERRLKAAAEGDFVVALYNPVSRRRRSQLEAARAILLGHRPPETPVVLARNLGREDEAIEVIRLDALHPDRADMLTLVLIGSSRTRLIVRGSQRWVYTPRGYGQKNVVRQETA
jgi:cobalt-precorrin 5A hydrolase / precorrin-3B C17-methyltransferase